MIVSVEVSVATIEQAQRPPRRRAAAEKVVAQILLAAAETRAEKRDAGEIEHENGEVDWADLHCAGLRSDRGCRSRDANCPL